MSSEANVLTWREAVRKRPAMYTGSTGFSGFTYILKLIIQSIFTQTNCNRFEIDVTSKLGGKIVFRNLQFSFKDSINEDLHIGSYEFSVLNALCKNYEFTFFDENKVVLLKQTYQKGELKKGKIENKEIFSDVLEIKFEIDDSIWDFEKINIYNINDEIKEIAFLYNGKTLIFKYLQQEEISRIVYKFEEGLLDRLKIERNWGDIKLLNYSKKKFDNFSMELAFGLSPFYYTDKFIGSYVNFAPTQDHGTHLIGFMKGIKKGLKAYVKKNFPDKKLLLRSSAIKKYLFATIHIQIQKPVYWGPTRGRLQNHEIIKPISKYVAEVFLNELEKNPKAVEDILRHFEYV